MITLDHARKILIDLLIDIMKLTWFIVLIFNLKSIQVESNKYNDEYCMFTYVYVSQDKK